MTRWVDKPLDLRDWLLRSLDMLADFHCRPGTFESETPTGILRTARMALRRLIRFDASGFALPEVDCLDFGLIEPYPPERRIHLQSELDALTEADTFGWVLNQTHATVLPASSLAGTLILDPIATRSRTYGMFIGFIDEANPVIPDAYRKLISVLMRQCASRIESIELYGAIRDANCRLEAEVAELSDDA